jgi:hypothetical protein
MDKAHGAKIAEIKAQLSMQYQRLDKLQSAVDEWKEKDSEREKVAEQGIEARLRGEDGGVGEGDISCISYEDRLAFARLSS